MSWRHHAIFGGKLTVLQRDWNALWQCSTCDWCQGGEILLASPWWVILYKYHYLCQISETSVEYLGHFERWHSPHWLTKIAIIQPHHFSFATSLAALCTGRRTVDIFPLLNLATSYIKCSILFIALHFLGHNRDIMMETLSVFPEPQKTHTTNLLIKQYGHLLHYWP